MPLRVFRLRTLRAANLTIFLLYAAIFAFWFFQSLYMQGTLHFSALTTGLAFVPMTLAVAAGATLAPRLTRRLGPRPVLVAGMLAATAGEALLTGVRPDGTYLAQVLPGGLVGAFGLGLSLVPATIIAVQGVPAAASGLASGFLNTSRFVGAALGLAALSTIAASHTHSEIVSGTAAATALTDGFQLQFVVGALFCLAGAAAAMIMLRPRPDRAVADELTAPERA
jgi:MFS family permease